MSDNWKVGDRVIIPHWIKITKRQGRINEIDLVDTREGQIPSLVMVKILRNGSLSRDERARRWMRLSDAHHLERFASSPTPNQAGTAPLK